MAASVTLPPPGPAREFYCRVSPGRPPPDTPTDRAHRKNFGAPHCSDPCSPLLAPARHCRLGCRGCRAPARYATTNCTSWARTNDQNVPDPNAAPTRPHRRLDMQYAQNWPLIKHYSFAEATRRPSTASLPSYRATRKNKAPAELGIGPPQAAWRGFGPGTCPGYAATDCTPSSPSAPCGHQCVFCFASVCLGQRTTKL